MTKATHVTVQIIASHDHNLDPDGYVLAGLRAAVRQYEEFAHKANVHVLRSEDNSEVGMMTVREIEVEKTETNAEDDQRAKEVKQVRAMQDFLKQFKKED